MPPKSILLLYKKSAFELYFLDRKSTLYQKDRFLPPAEIQGFQNAHHSHYASLAKIEEVLRRHKAPYQKLCRGRKVDYQRFDFVITVGGDGTFLEAARGIRKQLILGVNSDPKNSVGRFCSANQLNFEKLYHRISCGKYQPLMLNRIQLTLVSSHQPKTVQLLNDVLVSHQNPAAMSRYVLSIGKKKEEQRSSGLWIATASGSSGAIHSAGGRIIPRSSDTIQYRARELYKGNHFHYRLKGGILAATSKILVTSLMRTAGIFIDGAHIRWPFDYGTVLRVARSPYPLKTVGSL